MGTILVVDDRPINRQYLLTLLGYAGHRLLEASDGAQALAIARAERPDLVVTDIVMPAMDGVELAQQMRAFPEVARIPIIFFTATYREREARALAESCGVTHVLVKPVEPQVVLAAVDAALGRVTAPASAPVPGRGPRSQPPRVLPSLEDDVPSGQRRLRALLDLGLDLASEREPLRMLKVFCGAARQIVGAGLAAVGIADEDCARLRHFVAAGMGEADVSRVAQSPADRGPLGRLLRERRVLRRADFDDGLLAEGFPLDLPRMRSFLGLPIILRGQVLGALCLADRAGGGEFDDEDERLAGTLAAQLAVAYENVRLFDEIQRHAFTLRLEKTERQRAEEALRESEARFRSLVQNSSDTITVMDAEGTVRYISPAVERTLGHRQDELVGKRWFEIVHPDDLPAAQRAFAELAQAPGATVSMGLRVRHVDGSWRVLECTGSNLLGDSAVNGVVINSRDITERKRAEEALHLLAEAGAVLASGLDYESTVRQAARLAIPRLADLCLVCLIDAEAGAQSAEVSHVVPEKEALLREFLQGHGLDDGMALATDRVLLVGKRSELIPEISAPMLERAAADAGMLELLRRLNPRSVILSPIVCRGQALGALVLAISESDRRFGPQDLALADELSRRVATAIENARLYREAQAAIRLREQFLSTASHELRTPLTVLRGHLEGLDRLVQSPLGAGQDGAGAGTGGTVVLDEARLTRALQKLIRASERLTALTDQLLDVTRLQAGRLTLDPERFDLLGLLSVVVENFRQWQAAGGHGSLVALEVVAPSPVGVWGTWDRGRLEQVLVNLIDNAFKYSPSDGAITISLAVESPGIGEGGSAHLVVRDRGIGIPPEDHERIFQSFVRAENASSGHFPGLGLGLAIAKEIVERHGGRIWVESNGDGQGSAFHVLLPRAEAGGE